MVSRMSSCCVSPHPCFHTRYKRVWSSAMLLSWDNMAMFSGRPRNRALQHTAQLKVAGLRWVLGLTLALWQTRHRCGLLRRTVPLTTCLGACVPARATVRSVVGIIGEWTCISHSRAKVVPKMESFTLWSGLRYVVYICEFDFGKSVCYSYSHTGPS